jgi:hypothetical protein
MTQDRSAPLPLKSLLVPAVATLGVTLLRLAGELLGWSTTLFGDSGGGAIVGIVWLVPVFGVYFACSLAARGPTPRPAGVVGHALGAAGLVVASGAIGGLLLKLPQLGQVSVVMLAAVAGAWVAYRGFPALGRTLLLYGVAARVPVIIVMLVAILASWHTHYNAPPPALRDLAALPQWFLIGVIPQTFLWIPFTMIVGVFFGGIALVAVGYRQRAAIG